MNSLYPVGRSSIVVGLLLFLNPIFLAAQPANDNCWNAILLDDLNSFCSADEAFSNISATADEEMPNLTCTNDLSRDVWFKFVATAPNITITVIGETSGNSPGGTLRNPAVELSVVVGDGTCSNDLDYIDCSTDEEGTGITTITKGGLVAGTEYMIRIQGTNNRAGTFKLCINNYTPPFPSESDCSKSHLLCDKSSFFVEKIVGAGDDPNEAEGTCLDCNPGVNTESSSTWYKWIAGTSGSLTFTLTPENPEDDLDFALYLLPDGINDCDDKRLLRCMASGENLGDPFFIWEPCTGETGLRIGDGDESEACGCQEEDNNFAEAINMVEGRTYALLINNFSETESGFTISFGGTGEFLGPSPVADFETIEGDFCAGSQLSFSGANSSFVLGDIVDYTWSFGNGAEPTTASGIGPHNVTYSTPGEKNVLLTVEADLGCFATDISEAIVVIEPCCEEKNNITADGEITDAVCLGSRGAIDVSATSNSPIINYQWNNNQTQQDLANLLPNDYQLTITNLASCEAILDFTVDSIAPFDVVTDITMPTCNGGTDGAITLNIMGDAEPILVDFGMGFENNRTLDNLEIGDYSAIVRDTNGCFENLMIRVDELALELDSGLVNIQEPSCFGFSDGGIFIEIANGQPNYEFDWNDGRGFVTADSLVGIEGDRTYQVNVVDENLCKGAFEFMLGQPEALTLSIDTLDISCKGADDGVITAIVEGGTGDYQYAWSNNESTEQITNLTQGEYTVDIFDENGCEISGAAFIEEPTLIGIEVTDVQDAICFGDNSGVISVQGTGGNGIYEFSADGINFQSSPDLMELFAGDYTVFVRDPRGCIDETMATIDQPEALTVDAGEDRTIDLGYSTDFQTIASPFTRNFDYTWSSPEMLDCIDCPNPTATPPVTTFFVVTITDETNCTASDSVMVFVNLVRPLFIPNVFSPNLDGNNDNFTVFSGPAGVEISELQIFDRWGNLIYDATNLPINDGRFGWNGLSNDGREMQPGVYAYMVTIRFFDGVEEISHGDITLVR